MARSQVKVHLGADKPILCFGEVLLRLTPSAIQPENCAEEASFFAGSAADASAARFDAWWGGSEANVAVGLASLQRPVALLTSLPNNPLGAGARAALEEQHVVVVSPGDPASPSHPAHSNTQRLGLYFTTTRASGKTLHYDRAGSTFSLQPPSAQDVAWPDYGHFHTSGINPALSKACRQSTLQLLRAAKDHRLSTSFDLNLRKQLWTDQEAGSVLREALPLIDLMFAHAGQLESAFDLSPIDLQEPENAGAVLREFCIENGLGAIIATDRESRAKNSHDAGPETDDQSQVRLLALYCSPQSSSVSNDPSVLEGSALEGSVLKGTDTSGLACSCATPWQAAIDRSGSGDSFAAGVLAGLACGSPIDQCLEQGLAAASLANQSPGDFPTFSRQDVKDRMRRLFGANETLHTESQMRSASKPLEISAS